MQPVITRAQARAEGLSKYFTGVPCKRRGHVCERLVSNTKCVQCNVVDHAEWKKANAEHVARYQSDYAAQNKDAVAANKRNYAASNPAQVGETQRRYYESHRAERSAYAAGHKQKNRERIAARMRRYNAQNRGRLNALAAKYKAAKRRATPPWANLEAIRAVYEAAGAAGMEVDHEIPLRGRLVCGLHVENNLRAVPAHVNRRKSAKFELS